MASIIKKPNGRWQAWVRRVVDGKKRAWTQTKDTKREARAWATEMEAALDKGKPMPGTRPGARLMGTMIEAYLVDTLGEDLKTPRNRRGRERVLGWWKRRLGKMPLEDVKASDIRSGMRDVLKGKGISGRPCSKATANRYLAAIAAVFRFGILEDWLPAAANPTSRLMYSEDNARVRWLRDDEIERLLAAVSGTGHLELATLIALTTGGRQGEIMQIRRRDIDFKRRRVELPKTKNGLRRVLPLMPRVLELLSYQPLPFQDDRIFLGPRGGCTFPRRKWNRAVAEAGIEDFEFHDLRHTAASILVQIGESLYTVGALLGHTSYASTQRYAHLASAGVSRTAELLYGQLFGDYEATESADEA